MKKVSVRRGRLPIALIVASVLVYTVSRVYSPLFYVSVGLILLAVLTYYRSLRCPYCNYPLEIAKVQKEEEYICPHCENRMEVEK